MKRDKFLMLAGFLCWGMVFLTPITTWADSYFEDIANVIVWADNDSATPSEAIYLRVGPNDVMVLQRNSITVNQAMTSSADITAEDLIATHEIYMTGNTFHVDTSGNTTMNGTLTVDGVAYTTGIDNTGGNITNAGAISGATQVTATGMDIDSIHISDATSGLNNITGVNTLTATNLGGTLTTAAQGNITSVGTLTSLGVSGAATVGGALGVTGSTTLNGATSINNTLTVNSGGGNNELTVGTNTVDIGSATSTNTILGTTNVTGTTNINSSGTATTNIGTAGGATNIGNASSTNTITGATNTITAATSNTIGVTGGSTITTTVNQITALTADGGGLTVNNDGVVSLLNSADNGGHGLTINPINTVLTGGGSTADSSSLTLADSAATLAVGTASTSEVQVLQATNDGTNTSVFIGDTSTSNTNVLNYIGARADSGVNNLMANATNGTNNIEAHTNNIGVATMGSVNNIGNSDSATTVSLKGGNAYSSIANNAASMGVTGGGSYAATRDPRVIPLTGPTDLVNGNTGSQDLVRGAEYWNRIEGNTLVDGNMYINGTLVYSSSTSALTSVTGGDSVLVPAVTTASALTLVNKGQASPHTVINDGVITMSSAAAEEATAGLTLTNGLGNTHGLAITESQTVISGGTSSTSLTLNNWGATFNNSGSPARVTGVADGENQYDAVNFGQLQRAYVGIASVSALTAIPSTMPGKKFAIGAGYGYFESESAFAIGLKASLFDSLSVTAGVGFGVGHSSNSTYSANAGFSYSF